MSGRSSWTLDQEEIVTKLWADGMSASIIAARLGEGHTRCSVIGKVHRMNLPIREWAGNRSVTSMKERKPYLPPKPKIISKPPPVDAPLPLGEPGELSTKGCKAPMHDSGKPWVNCGHPRHGNTVWCEWHHIRNSSPAKSRSKE